MQDGTTKLTCVDDPKQGDGKAQNQEHVIAVGKNGAFQSGKVTGFLIETKT